MPHRDERIDAYIAKSAPFARPILAHLRAVVHEACADAEETLKWSAPHFMHGGRILAGMAAFKQHAAFAVPMLGRSDAGKADGAMGHYGRLTALSDLPARRTLVAQLKSAAKAIDAGESRTAKRTRSPSPPPRVPADLAKALSGDVRAKAWFAQLAPSHKREYIDWIVEAKREETRARRVAQAAAWLAEGKQRNWKYQK